MACNYKCSITQEGEDASGLRVGTELEGQKKVYDIYINPPKPMFIRPVLRFDRSSVRVPVCVGKPTTILCDGQVNSKFYGGEAFWLTKLPKGVPKHLPFGDPSLYDTTVESSIGKSVLGAGVASMLTIDPVKEEHLNTLFICKLQSTDGAAFLDVELYSKTDSCQ